MPTVRYGQRKVDTTPLPGVRKTAAETPLSTGAGLEQARAQTAGAIADLGGTAAQVGARAFDALQQQERQRADQVALLNADNQLAAFENQRLYDPASGALAVKGRDAFDLPEKVGADFEQTASGIEEGLATDSQRQAFQRLKAQRWQSIDLTVRRHVFGEMQQYEAGELKSLINNAQSTAIANALDPRRVGEELSRAVAAIRTHAPRLGLGPEQVDEQIAAVTSATHVGVIDRLLSLDQSKAASIYFDETKGQIRGDAIGAVEKALEEGTLRASAQKQADAIVAAGGTLTDQREKARAIDDPKLRDAVMERIEHEAVVRDREDRERQETTLRGAFDVVDRTHDVTQIPPVQWASFSGAERAGLRSYAESLARGVPVETDLPTYYDLLQQAADDPQAFATVNLLQYRGKLDSPEFKQLANVQMSLRQGDRKKADEDLQGFRTTNQIIEDSLSNYGIDPASKPTTPQGKAIAQLRRMLDRRVEEAAALTGRKPSSTDVQTMVDDLLSQPVTIPGSWWNFWPGGKSISDTTGRLLDLTPADIPADDRRQIEDALRRAGRPVSDATVLDLYLETRARIGK
jgi:hypothetical protein